MAFRGPRTLWRSQLLALIDPGSGRYNQRRGPPPAAPATRPTVPGADPTFSPDHPVSPRTQPCRVRVFTAARGQLGAEYRNSTVSPRGPPHCPDGPVSTSADSAHHRPSAALAVDTAEPSLLISSADGDLLTALEAPRRVGTRAIDADEAQHTPQDTSALPCQSIQLESGSSRGTTPPRSAGAPRDPEGRKRGMTTLYTCIAHPCIKRRRAAGLTTVDDQYNPGLPDSPVLLCAGGGNYQGRLDVGIRRAAAIE